MRLRGVALEEVLVPEGAPARLAREVASPEVGHPVVRREGFLLCTGFGSARVTAREREEGTYGFEVLRAPRVLAHPITPHLPTAPPLARAPLQIPILTPVSLSYAAVLLERRLELALRVDLEVRAQAFLRGERLAGARGVGARRRVRGAHVRLQRGPGREVRRRGAALCAGVALLCRVR